MSNIDPDADRVVETRTRLDPVTGTTEVTRTTVRSSAGAWALITIVAIVAMITIGFMVTRQPPADNQAANQALAAAADQGRAQGAADAANASAQAALQTAQSQAQSQAIQAADARAQAQASAASAADSARVAKTPAPSTDNSDQAPPQS